MYRYIFKNKLLRIYYFYHYFFVFHFFENLQFLIQQYETNANIILWGVVSKGNHKQF